MVIASMEVGDYFFHDNFVYQVKSFETANNLLYVHCVQRMCRVANGWQAAVGYLIRRFAPELNVYPCPARLIEERE